MSTEPTLESPQVRQREDRFEILVAAPDAADPEQGVAGFTQYLDVQDEQDGPVRIFPHTVVGEEYGGHGLASTLVRSALDRTIEEGRRIVAVCPYVKAWIPKHPEYQEHTVPVRPTHLAALRG